MTLKNPSSLYEVKQKMKNNYKDVNIPLRIQRLPRNTKMLPTVNYYYTKEEKKPAITTSIY